jgi:septal ring factor EnvC (AmiA/AmiB activator)
LIIAIIAVIFAVQNAGEATIKFLVWEQEIPLAVGLFIAVLLGALVSLFASLPTITRQKIANRKMRKQISETESSLQAERTRLSDAQKQLLEMDALKAKITAQEAQLSSTQQKIQVLEGRLALEVKKSGVPPTGQVTPENPES